MKNKLKTLILELTRLSNNSNLLYKLFGIYGRDSFTVFFWRLHNKFFRDNSKIKFIIRVEMKYRWVPHFLAMLRYMQFLGSIGSSRKVSFYADGDGDFRPKFSWDNSLSDKADPIEGKDSGDYYYDAG